MFERKPPPDSQPTATPARPIPSVEKPPIPPSKAAPPLAARPGEAGSAGEIAAPSSRKTPAQPFRPPLGAAAPAPRSDTPQHGERTLIVGRGIAFSAEISACDHLIVEGTVEARLPGAQRIDIAESGLFRGTAGTSEGDIGGRFEGELTVSGRLIVRSTGRIEGKIQYGELAVEAGGRIEGELRIISEKSGAQPSRGGGSPASAVVPQPEKSTSASTANGDAPDKSAG